jgi:hypothetical protein
MIAARMWAPTASCSAIQAAVGCKASTAARTDDAVDVFLAILTNGKVTEDKVGPHGDLLAEFPYLGPPHNA